MTQATNHTNFDRVTDAQLAAIHQHEENGKTYFTADSSTGEGFYTLRLNLTYNRWMCNCRWAREGNGSACQHVRSVQATIAIEQDAAAADELAIKREQKAMKQDPSRYLEHKAFSLLK